MNARKRRDSTSHFIFGAVGVMAVSAANPAKTDDFLDKTS
jgi:hypothetical protein